MNNLQVELVLDELFDRLELDCSILQKLSWSQSLSTYLKMQYVASYGGSYLDFYTKYLPNLGKALDAGFRTGYVNWPFESTSPMFRVSILGKLYEHICDPDGFLLPEPSASAIKHVRQICFFAYKLKLPYSKEQEDAVIQRFLKNEEEVSALILPRDHVLSYARTLVTDLMKGFDPEIITPRHGPGAVSTGEVGEEKWAFKRRYSNLDTRYRQWKYFYAGKPHVFDSVSDYRHLERLESGTAKVILVQKDSRGPRLISCEPLEYMFIQQGLGRALMAHVESRRVGINFSSQSFNQSAALESSRTFKLATLDLEDASDRVSLALVKELFADVPDVLQCLIAARTAQTVLPDGTTVSQRKFAPMGSATCFPVESICFWAIVTSVLVVESKVKRKIASKSVLVYGDDIIVPTSASKAVIEGLERYGLKVNRNKSFYTGPFRESCGMDAYLGVRVTPFRLRSLPPSSKDDVSAIASWVSLGNALSPELYTETASYILSMVEKVIGKLPYGTVRASYLCRVVTSSQVAENYNVRHFEWRYNGKTFQVEFNFSALVSKKKKTELDGYIRLLRNFTVGAGDDPSSQTVKDSVQIRRRWSSTH